MSSRAPLVSVVIATYERPEYLRRALASVVGGDYRNVQIVVADDCGSAANRDIAASFSDPRIVYHRHRANLGIAANHIHAFRELVAGEFVAILNDDDEWEPSFLSRLTPRLIDDANVVIAFSDHHVMNEHGRIDPVLSDANTRRWRRDVLAPGIHRPFWRCLLEKTIPLAQASVIRRGVIDWRDFPADTGSAWDHWLGYLACRTGMACYYLPERLTRYRVHENAVTATPSADGASGMILLYSRLLAMPELAHLRSDIERRCGEAHLVRGRLLLQSGKAAQARAELRRAAALAGITPKLALAYTLAHLPGAFGGRVLRTLGAARSDRQPA